MTATDGANTESLIDQLVSSWLERPVRVHWARASGLPLPDRFEAPSITFGGLATAWLDLDTVVWRASRVAFTPGLPATLAVTDPVLEVTVAQAAVDRWLGRFDLPFRLELGADALIVHTEVAALPLARLDARIGIVNGWFVLQPQRASFLGMPNYLATLFRTYLPLPPLADSARLADIQHAPGRLTLAFALRDFTEAVTPGLFLRLQRRLTPTVEGPFGGLFKPPRD